MQVSDPDICAADRMSGAFGYRCDKCGLYSDVHSVTQKKKKTFRVIRLSLSPSEYKQLEHLFKERESSGSSRFDLGWGVHDKAVRLNYDAFRFSFFSFFKLATCCF